jgi:hypothetical protein
MQVNDIVKVKAEGEYLGRAGVVIRNEKRADVLVNMVQMDKTDANPDELPVAFEDAELEHLGR